LELKTHTFSVLTMFVSCC